MQMITLGDSSMFTGISSLYTIKRLFCWRLCGDISATIRRLC